MQTCRICEQRSTFSLSAKAVLQNVWISAFFLDSRWHFKHHDTLQNNARECFLVEKTLQITSKLGVKIILPNHLDISWSIDSQLHPKDNYNKKAYFCWRGGQAFTNKTFTPSPIFGPALQKLVSTISASGVISHKTVKVSRSTWTIGSPQRSVGFWIGTASGITPRMIRG